MLISLFLILQSLFLFPTEEVGIDSGYKSIIMYKNNVTSDTAILIFGGIHGDERETVDIVNYLYDTVESSISTYYIPNINPTLSYITSKDNGVTIVEGRRGYLKSHLDKNGFVKPGSDLSLFSKKMYYRIFYGNNKTYKNGIKHYIDPNRDFSDKVLPSTRNLLNLIDNLSKKHKKLVVFSVHAYMYGGRIYPEYEIDKKRIIIPLEAKKIAREFEKGSGYIYRDFYEPAIPIKERFIGEFINFTSSLDNVIAMDIELDKIKYTQNRKKVLLGLYSVLNYFYEEQ